MNVLVDTCIWSHALRRKPSPGADLHSRELLELIKELRVEIIGQVRQEVLSGIKSIDQYEILRNRLREFPDLQPSIYDYEKAAEYFNTMRSKGIQGSNTDYLLCAISQRLDIPIYTTDKDFQLFAQHLPVALYKPRF